MKVTRQDDFQKIIKEVKAAAGIAVDKSITGPEGAPISQETLFEAIRLAGQPYRRGCGLASRKSLGKGQRAEIRSLLFRTRFVLDSRIEHTLSRLIERGEISLNKLTNRRVFGFCKKQGVSFRLSLSTCVPSTLCGGGCYAHDGRERVTSTILSGCYNTLLAKFWERGLITDNDLLPHIEQAIELARADANFAQSEYGFKRRARIRLAHVGELAAFPEFANWLAKQIREISNDQVDPVVYTRHPKVRDLDPSALIVNLTIDSESKSRRAWASEGVRIVWSAWDGELDDDAEINFLEHHDNGAHSEPSGNGDICPVTISSTELRFCDAFACTRCFDRPEGKNFSRQTVFDKPTEASAIRTRKVALLSTKPVEDDC